MSDTIIPMATVKYRLKWRLGRLNRDLRKTRGKQAKIDLGEYYIIDKKKNKILEKHVDPVKLARDMFLILDGETVETEK